MSGPTWVCVAAHHALPPTEATFAIRSSEAGPGGVMGSPKVGRRKKLRRTALARQTREALVKFALVKFKHVFFLIGEAPPMTTSPAQSKQEGGFRTGRAGFLQASCTCGEKCPKEGGGGSASGRGFCVRLTCKCK